MLVQSVGNLVDSLRDMPILRPDQFTQLEAEFANELQDPQELLKRLVRLRWLTLYQAKKILNGRLGELLLGHYVILEKIGEGGMGKVYKAWQTRLSRVVALKVIRQTLLTNDTVLRRFQREAKAAAQLTHNNIVRLFDADQIGDRHYLAMEFVEGVDFSHLVKANGPLAPAMACSFIRQAALGLQHAHEKGLVHRDIKPSNLLVTTDSRNSNGQTASGIVKILDMGLARAIESENSDDATALTVAGTVVGTPDYMSPEQGKNSSTVDPRSDLYSLGCTLYYLLAGQAPFPKGSTLEKLLQHQMDTPPSIHSVRSRELPAVPALVETILMRLLEKHPDKRFQSGQDLAIALEPCLTMDIEIASPTLPVSGRATSVTPEDQTSPFNFDDLEMANGPLSGRTYPPVPPAKTKPAAAATTAEQPRLESLTEAEIVVKPKPTKRHRLWLASGVLALVLAVIVIVIAKNRKPKAETPTPAEEPTASHPNEEPPKKDPVVVVPPKKEAPASDVFEPFLPADTGVVLVLNVAQLANSPVFKETIFPELDPLKNLQNMRIFWNFDPFQAIDRIVLAVPFGSKLKDSKLFLVQGTGFLTPEFRKWIHDDLKAVKIEEKVKGTAISYYELPPKKGEPQLYAAEVSQAPLTVAISSDKDRVIAAALLKAGTTPRKKDAIDPALHTILRQRYSSAEAIFLGMGGHKTVVDPVMLNLLEGVQSVAMTVRFSSEMQFDLYALGDTYEQIIKSKNNMGVVLALFSGLDKNNEKLARFAELLKLAVEKNKNPDGKTPLVHWSYHVTAKEVPKWIAPFLKKD